MAKILHLFRAAMVTSGYLDFINQNFVKDYHEFWVHGDRSIAYTQANICAHRNAKYVNNIIDKLSGEEIYQFDKIIYHGIFDQSIIDFFAKKRRLLDRLYLYFWGGDKFYVKDRWDNVKKKYVIRNAHGIINIIPEEHRYMLKFYHPKGKFFCAIYPSENIYNLVSNLQKQNEVKTNKEFVSILLGNSATLTNHHISILHKLAKFKDERIKIYVPLSYGSCDGKEYVSKVIKEGQKIFGEKFIAITQLMKQDEYYEFLNRMDIGIFDMNRQQAMGNITAMVAFGKKVYLRNHSVLWHYLSVENRYIVYKTEDIERMTFENFVYFDGESAEKNREIRKLIYCYEPQIESWKRIFDERG